MKQIINLFLILLLPIIFKGNGKVQSQVVLFAPNLITPEHQSASMLPPEQFIWNKVENADHYSIQITTDVTFLNLSNSSDLNILNNIDTIFLPPQNFLLTDTMYFWRVKAASNTGAESDWSYIQMFLTGVDNIYEMENNNSITISPMPIQNIATISFNSNGLQTVPNLEQVQVFVFNSSGEMINAVLSVNKISENKIEFDANNYATGSYYLVFYDGRKIIGTKSVVVN